MGCRWSRVQISPPRPNPFTPCSNSYCKEWFVLHHLGMPKKPLNDEWRTWIRHNVSRGCSRDELFRILVKEGFDLVDIGSELGPTPNTAPAPDTAPKAALLPELQRHGAPLLELYTAENFVDARTCAALVELI